MFAQVTARGSDRLLLVAVNLLVAVVVLGRRSPAHERLRASVAGLLTAAATYLVLSAIPMLVHTLGAP